MDLPLLCVCENPAVLRRNAGELGTGGPQLICVESRSYAGFRRLARVTSMTGAASRTTGGSTGQELT